ncbi:MAG TPA: peptidoglycan-binding domain-containing protein [Methylocystis sp.]
MSNIDFSPRDERAGNAKRRAKPAAAKRAPFLRRVFGEKGRFRSVLFTGFAGLVAVGVPLNALFMQEGRRPAAAVALKMPPIDAARQSQAAPPSHPRPAPPTVAKTEAPRQDPSRIETAKPTEKTFDPIAQLLGSAAPRKSDATAGADPKGDLKRDPKSDDPKNKSVIFAQRALAKLGYSLHQDGVYGGTTRQAIEKFERSNGLPVKGELSPKILRLLGARTGVAFK